MKLEQLKALIAHDVKNAHFFNNLSFRKHPQMTGIIAFSTARGKELQQKMIPAEIASKLDCEFYSSTKDGEVSVKYAKYIDVPLGETNTTQTDIDHGSKLQSKHFGHNAYIYISDVEYDDYITLGETVKKTIWQSQLNCKSQMAKQHKPATRGHIPIQDIPLNA